MSATIVFDLGYGDSGKGTIVDFLVRETNAKTVVRFSGGPQNAHNVVTPDGRHHSFHQFGSGTLAGAGTIILPSVVVEPMCLFEEAEELSNLGVAHVGRSLAISEHCLINTPYHALINRAKEFMRGENRHGSCGWGINETFEYCKKEGFAPIMKDILEPEELVLKLQLLHDYCEAFLLSCSDKSPFTLDKSWSVDALMEEYARSAMWFGSQIVNRTEINDLISQSGSIIFEGSQGVLLDQDYGFFPYVTRATTTPSNALWTLADARYPEDIITIGVTRAYMTRHGAGVFVSEDNKLPLVGREEHNETGLWQGKFRVGVPDMVALRYAIEVSGQCDYLAVTCLDQVGKYQNYVPGYYHNDSALVTDIHDSGIRDLEYRESFTRWLQQCKPGVNQTFNIIQTIQDETNKKVLILSHGPTADDKEWAFKCEKQCSCVH